MLTILLSTAFMVLVCMAPPSAVLLRYLSIRLSRRVTSFLFGMWLGMWPFLFEKINKTNVVFSGESVPHKERVLVLANHRTEVDWMYLWNLAARKGCLGHIRYILKSSLMKLPVFGWAFQILEFIPVERKWEVDESKMRQILSSFKDPSDPLWLVVFPEGTDFTEQKCVRSQQFSAENGLPILSNVLIPKTRGFHACLETLRCSLDAVYDVTIAYKYRSPTFTNNLFGVDPSEVHLHVKRIPLQEIPVSGEDTGAWLIERFRIKDSLISDFSVHGCFPNTGTEGSLSTLRCLLSSTVVIAVTCICSYLTITSIWFTVYLMASCTYLASATYFNLRPSPILTSAKAFFYGRKTV